MRYYMCRLL
ncbi:hypothetical protein F383_04686 [Gossypium arboreum]|uniref:Uncharacterized protein n=1 Tax=Gossypium arboreum TaxID=29729 RepID=A0A0B0MHU8_GOSAR|nr:hypothetical protein F383_38225 [Gossypium arboreum]KHG24197.1 hypothetical protein F383_04686 [Gossypium arboreum]